MGRYKFGASDLLFGIQMLGMLAYVGAQANRMLGTVQGVSPAWFLCAEVFCTINVTLSYRGWCTMPTRSTLQLFVTHTGWVVGIALLLFILAAKADEVIWGWYDTAAIGIVVVTGMAVLLIGARFSLGLTDPIVRGALGAICRGIPHFALAYKMLLLGGNGVAPITVWAAHATGSVRIIQLAVAVRDVGWDRTRRGMAIAEAGNELTWIVATIAWLMSH